VALAGIELSRLDAGVEFDPAAARVGEVRLAAPAGVVTGSGSIGVADGRLDLAFATTGLDLSLPPLDPAGAIGLGGRAVFAGRVAGTLESPAAEVAGGIEALTLRGEPTGEDPAGFDLRWADGRVEARAELPGLVAIEGGGALDLAAASTLDFELASARLERLVALVAPAPIEGLTGAIAGSVALRI